VLAGRREAIHEKVAQVTVRGRLRKWMIKISFHHDYNPVRCSAPRSLYRAYRCDKEDCDRRMFAEDCYLDS